MATNLAPLPGNLPQVPGMPSGSSPFAAGGGGHRTSPLIRYLSAVRRFKWLVLLLTLIGLGGGYVLSRLRPEKFLVTASILIADPQNDGGAIQAAPEFTQDQWKELMKSFKVLEPVVLERRLYIIGPKRIGEPPPPSGPSGPDAALFNGFNLGSGFMPGSYTFKVSKDGKAWELINTTRSIRKTGAVGDSVGLGFGFEWLPFLERRWFGESFSFDVITPREAADDISNRLKIDMNWRGARFMHLTMEGQQSAQTAAILNDLMSRFVAEAGAIKKTNLTKELATLDTQVTQAQIKSRESDRALQNFQIGAITLPSDDRNSFPVAPGVQQTTPAAVSLYFQKRQQVEALQRDRDALVRGLARIGSDSLIVDYLSNIPTVKSSPELAAVIGELGKKEAMIRTQQVESRYTDSMPSVIADKERIRELRSTVVPNYLREALRRVNDQIQSLETEIRDNGDQLRQIPTRSIEEARLRREATLQASILDALTQRLYTKRLQEASAFADVSVFDKAVPPLRPSKNKKWALIVLGAMAGFGAGLGLAFLFDITDKRVRYADQITGGLGLTILGVIPEIRRAKGEAPTAEEAAQVIEAFRTVRLNLAHTVGEGPTVFTVSSPSPGDGKSLVSSNLALSFAEAGNRTLLIDGDTRRGELHRTFGVERRPGLLDHLVGELPAADLVRQTSHPMLKLITGGSRKRNAPELLGSPAMRELLASVRSQFDVIIVDSPPLGAGIDPFVLGTITGNLILVMRAGATERDLAEAKLQVVDQLPIRLIGAVLNDVRASMNDYKYYSYSYGYGAVDEGEERGQLPAVLGGGHGKKAKDKEEE